MPGQDGRGPKGRGPQDGRGGGQGRGTSPPAGPMQGGKIGIKKISQKPIIRKG